jgi:pyruvate formate lyase activating enzyme
MGALSFAEGTVSYDSAQCAQCDKCLDVCPNFSSPKCTVIDDRSLVQRVLKNRDFLDGITFSGGECTLQYDFILDVFHALKRETRLTCFVDTNGFIESSALQRLCEAADGFMFDLKAFDKTKHEKLTGVSNELIFRNLGYVSAKGLLYEIRTVIVAGFTDDRDQIKQIAAYVRDLNDYTLLRLIPFRQHGVKSWMRNLSACSRETALELHRAASEVLGDRAVLHLADT